ncbi:MAG: bifunctional adenosylcobinamide kinase/adenosylcobinamide-phosphate guanylyltransferase [Dehalococcoidia bacterium]|nr:bifunctional adenosylcobinamide kinase/adenosylcobinamide-phosphate guanylyltransferase [Dehalococcoidia bacterium]
MAEKFILILGGARSGKSSFAQKLAGKLGQKVLFVATGEPLDEEMALRIKEHRRTRPKNWRTLEIGIKVGQKLGHQINDAEVVLLDCLTLLVSNILTKEYRGTSPSNSTGEDSGESASDETISKAEKQVMSEMEELINVADKYEGDFVVVSNEVGLGLVPETKLGRDYRDILGRANQFLARHASEVYFMAAGIPLKIKESP